MKEFFLIEYYKQSTRTPPFVPCGDSLYFCLPFTISYRFGYKELHWYTLPYRKTICYVETRVGTPNDNSYIKIYLLLVSVKRILNKRFLKGNDVRSKFLLSIFVCFPFSLFK